MDEEGRHTESVISPKRNDIETSNPRTGSAMTLPQTIF